MDINTMVGEWAYRVNNGMPDPKNRNHLEILEATLRDYKYSEKFISAYIKSITEVKSDAHKDTDIRRKWEAKLNVRLKPKMQRLDNYYRKASLDYKCSTDSSLIKTRNTRKIFLYLTKQYDAFIKIYEEILTYDLKRKKLLIVENDTKKEEKEPYSFSRTINNSREKVNLELIIILNNLT